MQNQSNSIKIHFRKLNTTRSLNTITGVIVILVFGVSFLFRYMGLRFISNDMRNSIFPWFDYMVKNGIWKSLAQPNFLNYPPPYIYLLGLSTLTRAFLNRISAIKLISLAFDIFISYFTYKIVRLRFTRPYLPLLAGSLVFLLPTVILNSSYWGQSDSIFTAFLLASVYFFLTDHPLLGMLLFGVAFSFKLQSVFMLPVLVAMSLQKKLPWKYYLLIPAIYGLLIIPAGMAGQPWLNLVGIYTLQTQEFNAWSMNAATLYVFIPSGVPKIATLYFVLAAGIIIAAWILFTVKKNKLDLPTNLIASVLTCLTLVPFVLPRMHDRYFYPAEIFSLVLAFYRPRLWFLPFLFQASGLLVYWNYLLAPSTYTRNLHWAVLIMLAVVGISLWVQFHLPGNAENGRIKQVE